MTISSKTKIAALLVFSLAGGTAWAANENNGEQPEPVNLFEFLTGNGARNRFEQNNVRKDSAVDLLLQTWTTDEKGHFGPRNPQLREQLEEAKAERTKKIQALQELWNQMQEDRQH